MDREIHEYDDCQARNEESYLITTSFSDQSTWIDTHKHASAFDYIPKHDHVLLDTPVHLVYLIHHVRNKSFVVFWKSEEVVSTAMVSFQRMGFVVSEGGQDVA